MIPSIGRSIEKLQLDGKIGKIGTEGLAPRADRWEGLLNLSGGSAVAADRPGTESTIPPTTGRNPRATVASDPQNGEKPTDLFERVPPALVGAGAALGHLGPRVGRFEV